MRTLKLVLMLTYLCLTISCSDEEKYINHPETGLNAVQHQKNAEDPEILSKLITSALEKLDERETVLVSYGKNGYDVEIIPITSVLPPTAASKCSGTNAVKFAKCVDKLVKNGKCVRVSYDNGVYNGDVVPCKD